MISALLDTLSFWIDQSDALGLMLEFQIKAALMLAVGLAASACLRKRSASLRFQVVWLTIVSVPILLTATFSNAIQDSFFGSTLTTSAELPQLELTISKPSASIAPSVDQITLVGTTTIPNSTFPDQQWQPWLLLIWSGGVLAAWLGMFWRKCRLIHHVRSWSKVTDEEIFECLRGSAKKLGLKKIPRLFFAEGWIMPSTWGWLRPALVLPREAEGWKADRLQFVLEHELSHISRNDALTHVLARLSLSFVWFNPLAWWARHQLAATRESACDDRVVAGSAGNRLTYVGELLALVKHHLDQKPRMHSIGFAMAQSSAVGNRVRRLLDEKIDRQKTSRAGSAGTLAVWCAAIVCLSTLISCRTTTSVSKPDAVKAFESSSKPETSISRSPKKPRAGADQISFHLMEIKVPETADVEGTRNFWSPYLQPDAPELIPFDSIRFAAINKGVDMLTLGSAAEGQQLTTEIFRALRYASDFTGDGDSTDWVTKKVGVESKITGENDDSGKTITVDISSRVTEFKGYIEYPIKNGTKTVSQPVFESRQIQQGKLRIPNGGFVIVNNPTSISYEREGALERSGKVIYRKYLAIAASSGPLPPESAGNIIPKPMTWEDSLPNGTVIVNYEVFCAEKPAHKAWPYDIPKGPFDDSQKEVILKTLASSKGITTISYPKVASEVGKRVVIKSAQSDKQNKTPISIPDILNGEAFVDLRLDSGDTNTSILESTVHRRASNGSAIDQEANGFRNYNQSTLTEDQKNICLGEFVGTDEGKRMLVFVSVHRKVKK